MGKPDGVSAAAAEDTGKQISQNTDNNNNPVVAAKSQPVDSDSDYGGTPIMPTTSEFLGIKQYDDEDKSMKTAPIYS